MKKTQDERMAEMTFASIYPHYLLKISKKGRSEAELIEVIKWLTGFDQETQQNLIDKELTFKDFFIQAKLNPKSSLIKGSICGHRIEEISNPLTQKIRYMDKLVDELAKGKTLEKIFRK